MFTYKVKDYDITDILTKEQPTERERRAIAAFNKSLKSATCLGFANRDCDKPVHKAGRCKSCYPLDLALRDTAAFLSNILSIKVIEGSSVDPRNVTFMACNDCGKTCTGVYPFCAACLDQMHALELKVSMIPWAGLGLYVTRDLKKGHVFDLIYVGDIMTVKQYNQFVKEAEDDESGILMAKTFYVMGLTETTVMLGYGDNAGPLRYINQAVDGNTMNCRFTREYRKRHAKVELIKDVKAGCELFIDYGNDKIEFEPTESKAALEQRKAVIEGMLAKFNNAE